MSEQRNSEGFLSGYRVVDVTNEVGFLCGKILGDLGADAIKIEPPGGDPARHSGPFYKDIPDHDKSLLWWYANLNKRGITLNLETPDGRDIFKRLVKGSHFVIESFAPGYMASLGLGYEELEKLNPRLVMTSITPFGQTGPYAHYKGTDLVGMGMGGMQRLYGELDRPPIRSSCRQFYFFGGLHGALGSMVAHYHRELTGEGQHVDVSCQQAIPLALMIAAEFWDITRFNAVRGGAYIIFARPTPPGPMSLRYVYPCRDGYVLYSLLGGRADRVLASKVYVEWANREGMALDLKDYDWPHYDIATQRQEDQDRIEASIGPFFLTKTMAELFEVALQRETQLIPVNNVKQLMESSQLAARGYWEEVEHPELGTTITYPGWPVKMGEVVHRFQRRAPLLGEHNMEIYEGELGFSRDDLVYLKTQGVI